MALIKELKKNDLFKFNQIEYKVRRKFISEEKPLIANMWDGSEDRFYFDELEVEKINLKSV